MSKEILLAIDPGDVESAFCFMDMETYEPLYFAKEKNEDAMEHMVSYVVGSDTANSNVTHVAIEMLSSYGMSVGKTVLFTAAWVGRFYQCLSEYVPYMHYIYRQDEKLCICGQMRAKDSNVRQALIDRFAKFDFKQGKGSIKNHDWFWGFKADIWQSYAVGVTFIDSYKGIYTLTVN